MFLRIGHRGAKAYETENTIASFLKALELGANAVEFDVRQARDGTLVIIHDDTLKRVFNQDLRVDESTLEELKRASNNLIPTLSEALNAVGSRADRILVELKEPGCEGKVLDLITSIGPRERMILSSFHEEVLEGLRNLDHSVDRGLIYARHGNPIAAAGRLGVQYLMPMYRLVQTRNVHEAHARGCKVIVWTINSRAEAEIYVAKGVDGIASDRPDILNGLS